MDTVTQRESKSLDPARHEIHVSGQRSPAIVVTLAVASLATALVLIIFCVPLTTLTSTAATFGAGPGAQAWILSGMSVGAISRSPAG